MGIPEDGSLKLAMPQPDELGQADPVALGY